MAKKFKAMPTDMLVLALILFAVPCAIIAYKMKRKRLVTASEHNYMGEDRAYSDKMQKWTLVAKLAAILAIAAMIASIIITLSPDTKESTPALQTWKRVIYLTF